jgi:hypothetical protein
MRPGPRPGTCRAGPRHARPVHALTPDLAGPGGVLVVDGGGEGIEGEGLAVERVAEAAVEGGRTLVGLKGTTLLAVGPLRLSGRAGCPVTRDA